MAGVGGDQLQNILVVVIVRNGQEPGVAAEVVDHADTVLHMDLLGYVAAGCCVVGKLPDDRTGHQLVVEHTGQPASLQAQRQRGHHCV